MPIHALLRNLATLTRRGLLRPLGDLTREVVARVTDQALLSKRRVHPFAVLVALRTYALGRSLRGDATWEPVGEVTAALERAYELAFGTLQKIPRRVYVAVDISGSMSAIRDEEGARAAQARREDRARDPGCSAADHVRGECGGDRAGHRALGRTLGGARIRGRG